MRLKYNFWPNNFEKSIFLLCTKNLPQKTDEIPLQRVQNLIKISLAKCTFDFHKKNFSFLMSTNYTKRALWLESNPIDGHLLLEGPLLGTDALLFGRDLTLTKQVLPWRSSTSSLINMC